MLLGEAGQAAPGGGVQGRDRGEGAHHQHTQHQGRVHGPEQILSSLKLK